MSIDAMKLALEALESNPDAMVDCGDGHWDFKRDLAITALRAAIEQAQEPVAWVYPEGVEALNAGKPWVVYGRDGNGAHPDGVERIPLYLAPRQWQGLTDEEIIDVLHPLVMADMSDEATDYEIARAIEAKLKEKNT